MNLAELGRLEQEWSQRRFVLLLADHEAEELVANLRPMLDLIEQLGEMVIQLRDITRTVAANSYGSPGFADEAGIRSDRADEVVDTWEQAKGGSDD